MSDRLEEIKEAVKKASIQVYGIKYIQGMLVEEIDWLIAEVGRSQEAEKSSYDNCDSTLKSGN